MQQPSKLMPALYGGIIMGVISAVPVLNFVNCICCAGILFGGFMAVFFYKKDLPPAVPLTNSDGLQLGALAGVFGAVIGSILTAGIFALMGNVTGEMMTSFLEQYADQMPPGTMDQIAEGMREGGISILNFIMSLVIDTIFGLLGGLIGYSVFKSKQLPTVQPPAPSAPM